MKYYSLNEHLTELKNRLFKVLVTFIVGFIVCYYFSDNIYDILLQPLAKTAHTNFRKIIYTGLTEAFFTYIKLATFGAFIVTFPVIALQVYLFIAPGLYKGEKKIAALMLFSAPILFWAGAIFVYLLVMPKAWHFFVSFENFNNTIPIILEARISEYLSLIIQLVTAFGIAFQLPIVIIIANLLNLLSVSQLRQKRRIAIVVNFIVAGVLTPPDVLSQLALALPLLLLYEFSILICQFITNKRTHA
ncbi:MAG: twin-arginine translocase subunit TatC [Rickettsiaceae bacterium]|nr:MAG: twin-arginine translocase subunit TatC [Rickettsiaceae bacterium]